MTAELSRKRDEAGKEGSDARGHISAGASVWLHELMCRGRGCTLI